MTQKWSFLANIGFGQVQQNPAWFASDNFRQTSENNLARIICQQASD